MNEKEYELKLRAHVLLLERQLTGILRDTVRGDWQSGLRQASYDAQSRHLSGTLSIPEDFPFGMCIARYPQERNLWNHKVWALLRELHVRDLSDTPRAETVTNGPEVRNLQLVTYNKEASELTILERREILLESLVKLWSSTTGQRRSGTDSSESSTCADEPKREMKGRRRTSRKSTT